MSGPDEQDENGRSGSPSDLETDSDVLDDTGSRKRQRTSPSSTTVLASAVKSIFDVPSRITISKAKSGSKAGATSDTRGGSVPDDRPTGVSVLTDQATSFEDLGVKPWLVTSLANMAIKRPTGIQKGCIPEILEGRDCIGGSRTGTGKTVAFLAPILQRLADNPSVIYAVVLTPTRELALQIFEQWKAISSPHSLRAILVTGGADQMAQAIALGQRPHVVIATPGRLAALVREAGEDTICGLRRVRFVVLDEADRLLAARAGLLPDVEACLGVLPPPGERQTLLFTATVTPEVQALREAPRRPGQLPVHVCEVDTEALAVPPTLSLLYLQCPVTHREHYLHNFLLTAGNVDRSVVVFVNRTTTCELLHHLLYLLGHRVTALHSKLRQRERTDNLGRFRARAARVLVATDVAARGLDIPEVSMVVNYDVPRDPDDFIHRVGRTARAGRKGDAVTFVGQRDVDLVHAIEERVGRLMKGWTEEGVNLERRVVEEALKLVSAKKREALLDIEEGRNVGGKRKRGKIKLRAAE